MYLMLIARERNAVLKLFDPEREIVKVDVFTWKLVID